MTVETIHQRVVVLILEQPDGVRLARVDVDAIVRCPRVAIIRNLRAAVVHRVLRFEVENASTVPTVEQRGNAEVLEAHLGVYTADPVGHDGTQIAKFVCANRISVITNQDLAGR